MWFEVLTDMSPALPGFSLALPGALRLVVGASRLVASAPSYSERRQECPPMVWYSPEKRVQHNSSPCEECNTRVILMMRIHHHKVKEVCMQRNPSHGRDAACNSPSEPSGTPGCFWRKLGSFLMHWVLNTPRTASSQNQLSPAPSQSLISRPTMLSSILNFPRLTNQPMNRVSAPVAAPFRTTTSRLTASKYSCNLAPAWPPSACPNSLDHSP